MRCSFCGSKAIYPYKNHERFSTGKAIAGALTFGVVGAAAGLAGKNVKGYRCSACGGFSEKYMDIGEEMAINSAVDKARSGDTYSYDRCREKYMNIEVVSIRQTNTQESFTHDVSDSYNFHALTDKTVHDSAPVVTPVKRTYCPNRFVVGDPIFVSNVTIQEGEDSDLLLLDICNTSGKTLRSVYLNVTTYDDVGDEISKNTFVYQGLSTETGMKIPQSKPFKLNTSITYKVDISCEKAAFTDDTIWRREDLQTVCSLSDREEITPDNFNSYKYLHILLSQMTSIGTEQKLYYPVFEEDYHLCICGNPVARGDKCLACGLDENALYEVMDYDVLKQCRKDTIKNVAKARFNALENLISQAKESKYQAAVLLSEKATYQDWREAAEIFASLSGYKDSAILADRCIEEVSEMKYQEAVQLLKKATEANYLAAAEIFASLPGYRDADEQRESCTVQAENARKDSIYNNGWRKMHQSFARIDDLQYAMSEFNKIPGWKDTDAQIVICQQKIDELKAKAETDRLERERQAELARIEAAKQAKRKKTIAIMAIIGVLVAIAFVVVLNNIIIPNNKYNDAIALMDAGKYQEAISAFEALDGYKDSAAKLEKAKLEEQYLQAQTHVQNAQYMDAHRLLQLLRFVDGYTDKVQQLYRQIVDKCRSEGQYDLAVSMYKHINGFSEESEEYKDLVYHSGLAAMERGDYLDAAVAFGKISGYLDANTQYLEANYQRGIAYMNSKSYEYAITAFSQAQGHKDSGLQQLEAKYQLVLSLHAYKDAQAFSYLSDLKNAQYKNSADLFNKYYGKPENGDKIVIYACNSGMALSVQKSGHYNVGVEINDVHAGSFSNDIVLTVIVNNDGTYSFVHESQKLGMEDQYSSVNLGVQYDRWELISLDNGTYLLRNVKRDCFLAFSTKYGNWAAYEASDSDAAKLYQLAFIILDE